MMKKIEFVGDLIFDEDGELVLDDEFESITWEGYEEWQDCDIFGEDYDNEDN